MFHELEPTCRLETCDKPPGTRSAFCSLAHRLEQCGGLAGERPHHPSTRRHRGLRGVRPPARPRARELGQRPRRSTCLQPARLQNEEVWPVTRDDGHR
jgi:hypothetical protein